MTKRTDRFFFGLIDLIDSTSQYLGGGFDNHAFFFYNLLHVFRKLCWWPVFLGNILIPEVLTPQENQRLDIMVHAMILQAILCIALHCFAMVLCKWDYSYLANQSHDGHYMATESSHALFNMWYTVLTLTTGQNMLIRPTARWDIANKIWPLLIGPDKYLNIYGWWRIY